MIMFRSEHLFMKKIIDIISQKYSRHPFLRDKPYILQFIKFVIVGFSNLFIDFTIYLLLTRVAGVHYLWSNLFSFTVATVNSFFLNKKWTFRDTSRDYHKQYFKFYLVSGVGLGLNQLILFLLIESWGLYDIVAKCIAVVIVTFWNFIANRLWTFRETSSSSAHKLPKNEKNHII